MPAGDRTGPVGQGPMTGRALGHCSGYDTPGYTKGFGRGMGRGFGFGRGMGRAMGFGRGRGFGQPYYNHPQPNPWPSAINQDDEIKMLKSQAEALKRSQQEIQKRLDELEKD